VSRETVLARGRVAAERGMLDQCTIQRVAGSTTNPTNGVVSDTKTTIYTGKCRVQSWSPLGGAASPRTVGGQYLRLLRLELQLPVAGTDGLQDGDVVTMTFAAHDPDLLGRTFTVRDLQFKSDDTSRRIGVSEVI
jgi:hypothetical protein